MKILITGASGFIGRALAEKLSADKYSLVFISRNAERTKQKLSLKGDYFSWSYKEKDFPVKALEGVDTVIHLMGESIASGRWSKKRKEEIYNSRIISTRKLIGALPSSVKSFFCASATGIYASSLSEKYTENAIIKIDGGFLQKTCLDWEAEAEKAKISARRVIKFRTGIVLGQNGFLKKLLPLFQFALGGPIAGGKAFMSFIHIEDLVSAIEFCVKNKKINSAVNLVSENPVSNKEFTKSLAQTVKRPAFFNVPAFMLKTLLGEMSELVLSSQYVLPEKLLNNNFQFHYKNIKDALADCVMQKNDKAATEDAG
ncbi:MAG: TIGR01777 family oxidoreductase [Spirochaetia bacterium]|nr:TIGR01777 family oxidoreductase [Spirochaetia bacterium]